MILVLGDGDPSGPKSWVAEKPDMLNGIGMRNNRSYIIRAITQIFDAMRRRRADSSCCSVRYVLPICDILRRRAPAIRIITCHFITSRAILVVGKIERWTMQGGCESVILAQL